MVENFIALAKTGKINNDQIVTSSYLKSRITKITYLEQFGHLGLGTRKGEYLSFDFMKKDPYINFSKPDEPILQVGHLPPTIKDAKKHCIYILTDKNLYVLKKQRNCLDSIMKNRSIRSPDRESKEYTTSKEGKNTSAMFDIDDIVPITETSQSSMSEFPI